jgi:omega-6 fatty acid desaturase (delta-12 desaturase)
LYNCQSAEPHGAGELSAASIEPRKLVTELKAFAAPNSARSFAELAVTLLPFCGLILIMLWGIGAGYYAVLAAAPLAGLLLLRLFIIQHDCGHGSFFASRSSNDWTGRALGALTFTPYDCWKRSHALHHASTGNLDARGFGDVDTWTVREFFASSCLMRLFYRIYRHPIVLFGVGPAYLFLLRHRLPVGLMKQGSKYWLNAIATNLATGGVLAALIYFYGFLAIMLTVFPVLMIAASTGVWLFYIQHQFEEAHWDRKSDWSFHEAALLGSSHLDLPQPLRWFTGNIGVHHVHHLASRVPFYRLAEVLSEYPELRDLNRFTVFQSIKPIWLSLWDEDERRLVSFREARLKAV